jgi:outer membrane protein insertion porin family
LRGAVFADSGTLFGTTSSIANSPGVVGTTASLRASAGVGLIWDSPIGALRADYAFPLAKQSYDKTQPFSFGIATF